MRLHEVTSQENPRSRESFDLDTMSASRKLLVRKAAGISTRPEDGYRWGLVIDLLLQLMRTSPDDPRIASEIATLPGAARAWIMRRVVRRLPDGTENPLYKPNRQD